MNSEMYKSKFVFVCSLFSFTSTRVSLLCHYQFFSPYFPLQCCFARIVIHVEDEEDGSSTGGVIHWNTSPGCSVYVFFLDVWLHVELIYTWSVLLFQSTCEFSRCNYFESERLGKYGGHLASCLEE